MNGTTRMNRATILLMTVLPMLLISACSQVASRVPGYLTTPKGQLLRNDAGQCWRTVEWHPALARMECDPEITLREQALVAEKEKETGEKEVTKKTDTAEVSNKTGRYNNELTGFTFTPVREEKSGLLAATTKDITGTDGKVHTEVVFAPFNLSSDTSFRFGDDQLTIAGQDSIIELAGTLKRQRAKNIQIDIVGHTDRIGSAAANKALSRRRAESVKKILITTGLTATSIRTAGMGADNPVTQIDECPNKLVKCELIECLRPDRRVEIRVKAEIDSGKRITVPDPSPPASTAPPQGSNAQDNDVTPRTVQRLHAEETVCRA